MKGSGYSWLCRRLTLLTSSGSTEEQRAGDRLVPRARRTVVKTLHNNTYEFIDATYSKRIE